MDKTQIFCTFVETLIMIKVNSNMIPCIEKKDCDCKNGKRLKISIWCETGIQREIVKCKYCNGVGYTLEKQQI